MSDRHPARRRGMQIPEYRCLTQLGSIGGAAALLRSACQQSAACLLPRPCQQFVRRELPPHVQREEVARGAAPAQPFCFHSTHPTSMRLQPHQTRVTISDKHSAYSARRTALQQCPGAEQCIFCLSESPRSAPRASSITRYARPSKTGRASCCNGQAPAGASARHQAPLGKRHCPPA